MSAVGAASRRLASLPGSAGLVGRLDRAIAGRSPTLAVLTYHRVDEPSAGPLYPGLLSATPAEFEAHVRSLARDHHPVSVDDLLAARDGGPRLPRRAVLVTLDDGYRDLAVHAWPILRRHGVPAVAFVATAVAGGGPAFWWDRLHERLRTAPPGTVLDTPVGDLALDDAAGRRAAFRRLRTWIKATDHESAMALVDRLAGDRGRGPDDPGSPSAVLGWDELRALAADGLAIAAHSRSHAMLDRLPADALRDEIEGSLADVAERLGAVRPVFAYPSGQHSAAVVEAARRAGIRAAFTTRRGAERPSRADWLRLRRINVGGGVSPAFLDAQILAARVRAALP